MTKRNMTMNSRRGRNNVPTTVLVAPNNDTMATRVDRTIASMRFQQSSCVLLAKSFSNFTSTATDQSGVLGFNYILSNEDVVALSSQFNEVKIKCIRYDIYHTGQSGTSAVFGTYHTNGSAPPTTYESVIDSEDSQVFNAGGERQQFYWQANGTLESVYQKLTGYVDFGGLRYNIPGQTSTGGTLFTVVISAVVVFRSRN